MYNTSTLGVTVPRSHVSQIRPEHLTSSARERELKDSEQQQQPFKYDKNFQSEMSKSPLISSFWFEICNKSPP